MPIGLGVPELMIVMFIVVMLFGVGRLPEVGKSLGASIRNFRAAAREGDEIDETKSRRSNDAAA